MLLQSPFLTSSLASFQQTSVSPTRAESTRGSAVWWGAYTVCPGRRQCHKFGRERDKESRGYFLRIKYQLGEQFLLPAASEAKYKTSLCPGKAARLSPVRTRLGWGLRTCPRHSCCHEQQREATEQTLVSAGLRNHLCPQHCLREAKGRWGSAHLTGSLVHTHYKSGCSFLLLRSLMQMAPNRFEKLPRLPAPLPQVQRQMSWTNLFAERQFGSVKINLHNQSLLSTLVQNRELGNLKQSLHLPTRSSGAPAQPVRWFRLAFS